MLTQYLFTCFLNFQNNTKFLPFLSAREPASIALLVIVCPCLPLSLLITQITQTQHPDIQNSPTIHSQRIPKEYPKNTQRIHKEFTKNSQRIHKEFTKNSQRTPKEFPKNSQRISKEFTKDWLKIVYKPPKNIWLSLIGRNTFQACFLKWLKYRALFLIKQFLV